VATFLLVEEVVVPGENHRPAVSHRQTLSHNIVSSTPRHERGRYTLHELHCLTPLMFLDVALDLYNVFGFVFQIYC
jgi:hypothetical protein